MKNFLRTSQFKTRSVLLLILFLGGIFRLNNINWDSGFHLHPDERMLIMVTEKITLPKSLSDFFSPQSTLNPKFFPYGSFPIYTLRLVSNLVSNLTGEPDYSQYSSMNLVGRILSVIFDLGTCFLLFKLGSKIFSSGVGLLAAGFYSLAVFPIQLSHFFAVDTFLTFFVTATLYRLVLFYEKPVLKNCLLIGLFFGLALATKVSATVLLAALGTASAIDLILVLGKRFRLFTKYKKIFFSSKTKIVIFKEKLNAFYKYSLKMISFLVISLAVAALIFVICEPYAIIDFPTFWQQTKEQQAMTKNAYVFPYTLQYVGTAPYLYPLKNFILWGAGIPLGTVSLTAIVFVLIYLIKEFPKPGNEDQEAKIMIFLVFFFAYFLVVGSFAVKFMRYLLPLYPIFFLFGAWFLEILSKKFKVSLKIFSFLILLPTLFWAISFASIYSRPTTRVSASEWMQKNIPEGSVIALEHWDDGLPLFGIERFKYLEMPLYNNDQDPNKWQTVEKNLKEADYIVLASNRLYVPLPKLADCSKFKICYPKTTKYYQDLFSGNLGFQKVAEFSSNPSFFGLEINDQKADESFTVYDHPKVIIFKKIK